MDRHPGGQWLINLAVGRDATGGLTSPHIAARISHPAALFESYHLRHDVAAAVFQKLPVLNGFPVNSVPQAPRPNDSQLYVSIKDRVRKEVFRGSENRGAHRRGSELAALSVLTFAVITYYLYARWTGFVTGLLFGVAGAWIGVTIQHCGNHGAMSTVPLVNVLLGMCNDLIGGASLTWRYHHQVSHHIHTNDEVLDEDVCSMYPLLRFDNRLPRLWFHRWQHLYVWAAYPALHLAFQLGDFASLVTNKTVGAELLGATKLEKSTLVLGKAVHYALLLVLPWALHGPAATLLGAAGYSTTLSIILAMVFFVSHNVPQSKPLPAGGDTKGVLYQDVADRDWGVQQILASCCWGDTVGNFFTGGLNLQIEHHLFPAISFVHYPAIARIVRDECFRRNVRYTHYKSLWGNLSGFLCCMKQLGSAPDEPAVRAAVSVRGAGGKAKAT
ncbi:inoleoyl-CoA desaturase [Monoraphidium neglectum]|uniref:Inoleoyl-CoA desaturase n=1 Tax=Monoraphidium neglectum TaxID=145388 RepID=A0A0D2K4B8_9CHLO|nr:inoleoyl-CoA desaturase [Monoraphidium neglectum]KIZ05268.1 inoleoyl-CoA desaturase [Monoraphidium neglectum]|eukprot:XP_013904287.1 inoleoyl-CoA desaturase [Monoraphidium neglectum]